MATLIIQKIPQLKPVLALDLDGTVRFSKSGKKFIDGPDDIELLPGIEEAIWAYRDKGYLIAALSNQGGVAWGFKTVAQAEAELAATRNLFTRDPFHVLQQCYHMETGNVEPYNHRSLFRKPDIGMLCWIEYECWTAGYIVDWDNSLMVGDRAEDADCARRAGIDFSYIEDFLSR